MNTISKNKTNWTSVIRIAGAYVAWCMGSGYATGQEIFQFFTSYGYQSFLVLAINLVGFLIIGPSLLMEARANDHFRFYCGKTLGTIYEWILPISLFAGMIILISGAGATLHEYYNLNHYVGALIMAALAFIAYAIGFHRFVKVVSFIGPVIIVFSVIIGIITVCRDAGNLTLASESAVKLAAKQTAPWCWLSGILYISYNLCGGSKYYSALGTTATNKREAFLGATIGSIALMLAILLMNTSMLANAADVVGLDVPTLYLARKISYVLGAAFSIILLMGIFSACSAMLWTVTERFVPQGSIKSLIISGIACLLAFLVGLLPFSSLIGVVYTIMGYAGLVFIGCVIWKQLKH